LDIIVNSPQPEQANLPNYSACLMSNATMFAGASQQRHDVCWRFSPLTHLGTEEMTPCSRSKCAAPTPLMFIKVLVVLGMRSLPFLCLT
jgi:hypothetical protein